MSGCEMCGQPVGTPHRMRCVAVWARFPGAWWTIGVWAAAAVAQIAAYRVGIG